MTQCGDAAKHSGTPGSGAIGLGVHVLLNYFPEVEPMKKILIRLPAEWLEEIDTLRGDKNRNEFIRELIRTKIGPKKFPPPQGRGRPPASG